MSIKVYSLVALALAGSSVASAESRWSSVFHSHPGHQSAASSRANYSVPRASNGAHGNYGSSSNYASRAPHYSQPSYASRPSYSAGRSYDSAPSHYQGGESRGYAAPHHYSDPGYAGRGYGEHGYSEHGYYARQSYGYGRRWARAERLPYAYYDDRYRIRNYWDYQLGEPEYGTVWVRSDDGADAFLVQLATGLVLNAVYGLFHF